MEQRMRVLLWHGWLLEGSGSNVYTARVAEVLAQCYGLMQCQPSGLFRQLTYRVLDYCVVDWGLPEADCQLLQPHRHEDWRCISEAAAVAGPRLFTLDLEKRSSMESRL